MFYWITSDISSELCKFKYTSKYCWICRKKNHKKKPKIFDFMNFVLIVVKWEYFLTLKVLTLSSD